MTELRSAGPGVSSVETLSFIHRMPFGPCPANGIDDSQGYLFRLYAPAAGQVEVLLATADGHEDAHPCRRTDDGWWTRTVPYARTGDRYRYRVDGTEVPDPASRANPDDVGGPCQLVDPARFEWRPAEAQWQGRPWCEAVIYELHVGTFTPEGTYAAAEARLEELAALGITAVELMPLAEFPGTRGWGYDGVLPFAPESSYGTPDDLKRFVQSAHRRGLMVLLDVVYNHFGPEGNYLHLYAPSFFTAQHQTPWGAAIDYEGEAQVREFFIHNALYWLEEFRFDGLRLDAVHAIIDGSSTHFLEELSRRVRSELADRRIHLVLENPLNGAQRLAGEADPGRYEAQWNDDFHHAAHVILTGETDGYYGDFASAPVHHLARCLLQGFAYQGEHSAFHGGPRGEPSCTLPPTAFVCFLQNHDQIGNRALGERLAAMVPTHRLRVLVAVLLLSPSPPLIFMGEESGATSPFMYFCDFEGELARKVKEGRRNEFAAFAWPDGPRTVPDPCDPETFVISKLDWRQREEAVGRQWLAFYQALLTLRRERVVPCVPLLQTGRCSSMLFGDTAFEIRWSGEGVSLVMQANLGDAPEAVPDVPGAQPFAAVGGGGDGEPGLPPWSMRMFVLHNGATQ
ncbi:MAG: malto-oligosyltrehalose trehalohydrolase [Methyloversatilis sp.]|uniref:malto-oligosyltrehalose trehalohydrolase n=1 Tax=Methyloversatilis sp. TaxID=2569862 RepID=UPI0025E4E6BD|nr:malto-oligosyltrehalose trehalohydrolase [Methyloversatilis sp.]MCR6666049.1 malto-oligosyltrehalose trehalohydrolase [Methyloversatilis sp.]